MEVRAAKRRSSKVSAEVAPALFGTQRRVLCLCGDPLGSCVIVGSVDGGGEGELACWELGQGCWLWRFPTDQCHIAACRSSRFAHGAASGQLWIRRTADDPQEGVAVPVELQDPGVQWAQIALDPPFLVGLSRDVTLFVWAVRTGVQNGMDRRAGELIGSRSFACSGPEGPMPGVSGTMVAINVHNGIIATLHATTDEGCALHLWDAATGQFFVSWQHTQPADSVAITLTGSPADGVIALADSAALRVFHLGELAESLGEWKVDSGGAARKLLAAGDGSLFSVHEHGTIEWTACQPRAASACTIA